MDRFVKLSPKERSIYFEGTHAPRNTQAQIPGEQFAKFQASFKAYPVDAVLNTLGV